MRTIYLFISILVGYGLTRAFLGRRLSWGSLSVSVTPAVAAAVIAVVILQAILDVSLRGSAGSVRSALVLLVALVLATYALVDFSLRKPRHELLSPRGVVVGAVALIAAMMVFQQALTGALAPSPSGIQAGLQLLEVYGLDAIVAGGVIGFILAEQQSAHERLSRYLAQPKADAAGFSWASWLKGSGNGALLVTLVVVAAMPPNALMEIIRRLGQVKVPGGFELTVMPDNRRREGPTPVAQASEISPMSVRGFSTPRLDQMMSLTFPPQQEFRAAVNPIAALGLRSARQAGGSGALVSRHVERDRAYLVLLGWGGEAAQIGADQPADVRRPPSRATHGIEGFGSWQERFLLALGPYVECINDYVRVTEDRRVLSFEALQAVRPLVAFTTTYRQLEHIWVRKWMGDNITEAERHEISRLGRDLEAHADSLQNIAEEFRNKVRPWANRPSAGGGNSEPLVCGGPRDGEANLTDLVRQALQRSRESSMREHGFAPYLTVFSATALSALGEERQAQRLLYDWLDARGQIEADLNRMADDPRMRQAQSAPKEFALVRRALRWHRFQVSIESVWLRWVAERSGERTQDVVPTSRATRMIVRELFPSIFDQIGQSRTVDEWRLTRGQTGNCRSPNHQWRQRLMDSYFGFVRAHLDTVYRETVTARELDRADIDLAEMLADVNVDCFYDDIYSEEHRRLARAFNISTSLAIRVGAMREAVAMRSPPRLTATEQEQVVRLDILLQEAERHSEALLRAQTICKDAGDRSICLALNNPDSEPEILSRKLRGLRRQLEALRDMVDR